MTLSIPDPYTTSLAVAMYYSPPRQIDNRASYLIAEKVKKEKNPQHKIQPSSNIGRNIDTYA